MCRRSVIVLALLLTVGVSGECAFAEPSEPARTKPDSTEVERNDQKPILARSDLKFRAYTGKRVRTIWVRNLDVFGASVDDTTRVTTSRLARFLNHLNFKT